MTKIYIAGAHSRAQTFGIYMKFLYPDIKILAYLYDNNEPNPKSIDGVPVLKIDGNSILEKDCPVYLATRGVNHNKLSDTLISYGMTDIRPVTVGLDLELRNKFLAKFYENNGRQFVKIDDLVKDDKDFDIKEQAYDMEKNNSENIEPSACVYVAKSIFDKELACAYELAEYEREIQVGAALTDKRINEFILTDHIGDNISIKNKQYCELTALYWIWKNAKEDIVGLCHYRRHFILPDHWKKAFETGRVDVVLALPLYVTPTLGQNYKNRHDPSDYEYMLEFVRDYYSNDYEDMVIFFNGNLYSPCNMFIMRKEVLEELCNWLFPILEAVEKHGGQKEDNYFNRYPGFLSERLISFFFEKNRERFKVVYSDKNFL